MLDPDDRHTPVDGLTDFWPASELHGVSHLSLVSDTTAETESLLPACLEIASLSDALRDLQAKGGTAVADLASAALREEMVGRLQRLARDLDPASATSVELRAEALAGRRSHETVARRIALEYAEAPPVEVLCGPLCTWRPKSRQPYHSFLAAVRHQPSENMVAGLHASFDRALEEIRDVLGIPGLAIDHIHPMTSTDLIACGGEANSHPKHFAYFLPEDEGVDGVPLARQRTLAFRNVYNARYRLITLPLAEALLDGSHRPDRVDSSSALMMWIRAHDLAHGMRLPQTSYEWRDELGVEPFMMLQEALADVYGFLLTVTSNWLDVAELTAPEMCAAFLAESLHYLRRGPWHLGDSGAAYLELGYLALTGHISVAPSGRIEWTAEELQAGMRGLAGLLAETLLSATDAGPVAELIAGYGWPARTPALATLSAVREEMTDVPTTFAYSRALPARPEVDPEVGFSPLHAMDGPDPGTVRAAG